MNRWQPKYTARPRVGRDEQNYWPVIIGKVALVLIAILINEIGEIE